MLSLIALAATTGQADTLYFKSSFGGNVTVGYKVDAGDSRWAFDLFGYDYSAGGANHTWDGRLNGGYTSPEGARIGDHRINVEDWNKNKVSIIEWNSNSYLRFALNEVTDTKSANSNLHKGRVQTELGGTSNWREFHYTVRCFLPSSSIDKLRTLPGSWEGQSCWFTLAEFFSQSSNKVDQSRIGVGIKRDDVTKTLFFKVDAQEGDPWQEQWGTEGITKVPVPLDEWFTMEIYVKWGSGANTATPGRVYVSITGSDKVPRVVCNIKGPTRDRQILNANVNRGYTLLFPMKVYTNKPIIDYARNSGNPITVNWDDFTLYYGGYSNNAPSNLNSGVISKN